MGFQSLLGGFALAMALLFWYLQQDAVIVWLDALNVSRKMLQWTALVFLLISVAHGVAIVRVLRHCVLARRLTLHAPGKSNSANATDHQLLARIRPIHHVYATGSRAWNTLFGSTGFFGFSNPHYEMLFMFREAWEIVLQTYQAYMLSLSVPRKWINELAVATIVLNCMSSPLVHLLVRKYDRLRPVINLVLDALLDFCCSIVIPFSILLPYLRMYDPETYTFPAEQVASDGWFVNTVSEIRQVLVTSIPDFVSTIAPHVSLLGYMMTFKNILRRQESRNRGLWGTSSVRDLNRPTGSEGHVAMEAHTAMANAPRGPIAKQGPLADKTTRQPHGLRRLMTTITHVIFVVWGCTVLGLHINAVRNTDRRLPGCKLHVSAWLSTRYPCSVMLLNCYRNRLNTYSNLETTTILNLLERSTLQVLIFSHCQDLLMPPVVSEFNQLAGMELFNCTLSDWPIEAAIVEDKHPRFNYAFFVLTNWTTFPVGLLHGQLPPLLTNLLIAGSNMTNVPESIAVWQSHAWTSILFERVPGLTQVPSSFCPLKSSALAFVETGLRSFPRQCMTNARVSNIMVSGSPVQSLPDIVGPSLQAIYAESTNLSSLPDWFDGWYQQAPLKDVALHGSPVCNSTQLHEGMSIWDTVCRIDLHTYEGYYDWDVMLPLRPL